MAVKKPIIYRTNLRFRERQLARHTDRWRISVHHTVTASPLFKRQVLKLIEQMHQWHLDRGWAGEGYHYVVDRLGRVYTARPLDYVGAHTGGHNTGSIGIAFLGDFRKTKLNARQRNALRWLLEHHIQVDAVHTLGGHREYTHDTECPALIQSYVTWLRGKYGLRKP